MAGHPVIPPGMEHIFNHPKPVKAEDTIPAVQAWDAFSAQVRDTIIRKSAGYGDAWQQQGYIGSMARVLSKVARLKNLMWREAPIQDHDIDGAEEESVVDNAIDLGALCAFLVANVEGKNRWGR